MYSFLNPSLKIFNYYFCTFNHRLWFATLLFIPPAVMHHAKNQFNSFFHYGGSTQTQQPQTSDNRNLRPVAAKRGKFKVIHFSLKLKLRVYIHRFFLPCIFY